ncbi:MAG: holo-[acyl-carrier protein] synthase [Tepidanaerobacteraceae bacterium]|nr:holo-[acyl-carrier protein] synthase [Tepidanaerobacteraceae bacterium]
MEIEIGADIVEIDRIKKACSRKRFLERFFTPAELESICKNNSDVFYRRLAGKFAAKEAVAKALGTGFRYFRWHEIEILNDSRGKPFAVLSGRAKKVLESGGFSTVRITISHAKNYALAFAQVSGGDDGESGKP